MRNQTAMQKLTAALDGIAANLTVVRMGTVRSTVEKAALRAENCVADAREQIKEIVECLEKII